MASIRLLKFGGTVAIAGSTLFATYYGRTLSGGKFASFSQSHCFHEHAYSDVATESKWDWNWDKRDAADAEDAVDGLRLGKVPVAKKHYIFIRHGQYNVNGYDDSERYLTDLGREQAKLTGERLSKLGFTYSKIVQSSMMRAKETCSIIVNQIHDLPTVETSDLLREGSPTRPDPANRANDPELKYFSDAPRIESAFRKFVHRPTSLHDNGDAPAEIFVCHANVIRYFICRVAQFPPQGWLRISLKHGSITWITVYSDGSAVVNCIGDSGFIPASKLSS